MNQGMVSRCKVNDYFEWGRMVGNRMATLCRWRRYAYILL